MSNSFACSTLVLMPELAEVEYTENAGTVVWAKRSSRQSSTPESGFSALWLSTELGERLPGSVLLSSRSARQATALSVFKRSLARAAPGDDRQAGDRPAQPSRANTITWCSTSRSALWFSTTRAYLAEFDLSAGRNCRSGGRSCRLQSLPRSLLEHRWPPFCDAIQNCRSRPRCSFNPASRVSATGWRTRFFGGQKSLP